ncbi:OmpA/MotB [Zymobacter palmae]|uniref:OmpA/MotB n=2 Tax=Zymobacter palmae TaxID=33074 RepID=A0A348HH24_9GAMM|nr:type VI secretion protein IcmF/TssM N-terminal domain-containing protein [Zymobacter palmae]BBG30926.1 OmpA/MotB [Zymobacter palmae]
MMNKLKYVFFKYQPYWMAAGFFLAIFLVWWLGVLLGFSSLNSLLVGILLFVVASAVYVLLLYRGVGQRQNLERLLMDSADEAVLDAAPADREEVSLLREQMLKVLDRLQQRDRRQKKRWPSFNRQGALYELPWYVLIGQPAVGKSTMVYHSGLDFPFADREQARIAGLGGTRHCDWFFSNDAVLLDTAGRYTSDQHEAGKWRAFLTLLKAHRPRRPLNGLIVAVSLGDLMEGSETERRELAERLRERIQETSDQFDARLPIYLMLTKSDLIPGFVDFQQHIMRTRPSTLLGATFPHQDFEQQSWGDTFTGSFDSLCAYWSSQGEHLQLNSDMQVLQQDPSLVAFPPELWALRERLSSFVGQLMTPSVNQRPQLLRGYYFVSALHETQSATGVHDRDIGRRFSVVPGPSAIGARSSNDGLIADVFRSVILPDQFLVERYTSNRRENRRKLAWVGCGLVAGAIACAIWGNAYVRNRDELLALQHALDDARQQDAQHPDQFTQWQSLDALRSAAAGYFERHHISGTPMAMRWGLYRGHDVEPLVRQRYFDRLRTVMLSPIEDDLNRTLVSLPTIPVYQRTTQTLNTHVTIDSVEPNARPIDNSANALAQFGRMALRTYQMMPINPREKVDVEFLKQHLAAFWYPVLPHQNGNNDAYDMKYASRQIDFYSEQLAQADTPHIRDNNFLLSSSRNYIDSLLQHTLNTVETITLESDTLFEFGRADYAGLQAQGRQQLNQIATRLVNTPSSRITITGFADSLGNATTNRQLSLERAQTIKRYLVGKGVPEELVKAVGAGDTRPLVSCDTGISRRDMIQCLAPNRRVEIEVRHRD